MYRRRGTPGSTIWRPFGGRPRSCSQMLSRRHHMLVLQALALALVLDLATAQLAAMQARGPAAAAPPLCPFSCLPPRLQPPGANCRARATGLSGHTARAVEWTGWWTCSVSVV